MSADRRLFIATLMGAMSFLSIYGHIIVDAIIESPRIPDNEEFIGTCDLEIR